MPDITGAERHADAALAARLRAGDESAFLAVVRRHHAAMVRLARVHVGSAAVAEEVAQETWLAVLSGIGGWQGRGSLKAWILAVLVNVARTRAAREGRSVPLSALDGDDDAPAVPAERFLGPDHPQWPGHWSAPPEPWADAALERAETRARIEAAIAALPPAQRQVMLLRDVEGLEAAETCAVLGLSEGNQRVLLHRARSRVRAALERDMMEGA